MAVNLLDLICCPRHNMATCITWDDLVQMPIHSTYSYLRETTAKISDTLKNVILSHHHTSNIVKTGGQVNVGVYALSCPETIAAILSILSLSAVYCPMRILHNLSDIHILMMHISKATELVCLCEENVVDINTNLIQYGFVIVVLCNHTQNHTHTVTKSLPTGSADYSNDCYACTSLGLIPRLTSPSPIPTPSPIPGLIAYMLHTTGTTGMPKKVWVPHCCIIPNIVDLRQRYSLSAYDRVLNVAPLTFDPSIVEIFTTLSSGATLVISPDHIKPHPPLFASVCSRQCVTVLQATPSLLSLWSAPVISDTLLGEHTTLHVLALGGEACPSNHTLASWRHPKNHTRLYNLYGITEVSSWASCYKITEHDLESSNNDSVPLGEALLDTILEVRDEHGAAVTNGYGTIWIGGGCRVCVVEGQEQFDDGMRCTGDIGYVKGGNTYFIGRCDRQIKRLGHRINLNHLEQKLLRSHLVSQCVMTECAATNTITCYIVPSAVDQHGGIRQSIAVEVRQLLLAHEHPNHLILVSHIPVNVNGKIDKAALMEVDPIISNNDDVINNDVMYDAMKRAVNDVMGVAINNNIHESLSEHGATSLDIIRIVNVLEEILGSKYSDTINSNVTGLYELLMSCSINKLPQNIVKLIREQSIINEDVKLSVKRKSSDEGKHGDKKCCSLESDGVKYCRGVVTSQGWRVAFVASDDQLLHCTMSLKWVVPTGRCVDGSPLLVHWGSGNIVYIGSHSGLLLAIDNGTVLWRTQLPDRIESSCCMSHDNRYVIVGCYDGSVYVVSAGNGDIYWTVEGSGGPVKSSPAVHPSTGYIWYGSHDKHVHAIDVETKSVIHKIFIDGGSCYSSVTFHNDLVMLATLSGTMAALDTATGGIVWRYCCNKPVFSSPCIVYDSVLFGCVDGCIYVLKCSNGHLVTTLRTDGPIFSSPVYYQSHDQSFDTAIVLCGSHDHHMHCWHYSHCAFTHKWSLKLDSEIYSIPCLGHVTRLPCQPSHDPHPVNSVVVCSSRGSVYVVCVSSGHVMCHMTLPNKVYSSPLLYNNTVIVGCRDDNVYCIDIGIN